MKGQTEQLMPVPTIETEGWSGYSHFKDPTRQPFNMLQYPSINCFVPSKDKVVPRKGKTLLGQGFSTEDVEIEFDSFSQIEEVRGNITEMDTPIDFEADNSSYNSCAKVDNTHIINFWRSSDSDKGMAQVFTVDTVAGTVTPVGTPLVFDALQAGFNSCVQIDANHFMNFWQGDANDGFVQVFEVNLGTYAVTALGSPLEFDTSDAVDISCGILNDGIHVVAFWASTANVGKTQVFAFDGSYNVTAIGSPLTFDAARGRENSCGRVDSSHFINFWKSSTNGQVQTFAINLGTFAITAVGSPLVFDAAAGTKNSCQFINSTHYINFWDSTASGLAQIFAINAGTFAVTAMGSPITFSSVAVSSNSCSSAVNGHDFVNFWKESATDKFYAQVFYIDSTAGTIEALATPNNFATLASANPFISSTQIASSINRFIAFFGEDDELDHAAIFEIDSEITSLSLEHSCAGDNRILFVAIYTRNLDGGGDRVTSVTYDGYSMTFLAKVALDTDREKYLYSLVNPSPGIHSVFVTTSDIDRSLGIAASSYSGALQVSPTIYSTEGPDASVDSISISETPTIDNSWIMGFFSGGVDYEGGLSANVIDGLDSPFEFATSDASEKYITKLSDTRFVAAWMESNTVKKVQVFEIDRDTGIVTALSSPLTFYTDSIAWGQVPDISINVYDETHFVMFWMGTGNDGFVRSFQVNAGTGAVTVWGAELEFDTTGGQYISAVNILSNRILATWSRDGAFNNFSQIFTLNPSTGEVVQNASPFLSGGQYNSLVKVSDEIALLSYSGGGSGNDGVVVPLSINHLTWEVGAAAAPFTFYTPGSGSDTGNDLLKLSDNLYVNWFVRNTNAQMLQALSVDENFNVTNLGSAVTVSTFATFPNAIRCIQRIDETHFILFFKDTASGIARIYEIDPDTGGMIPVGDLVLDSTYTIPVGADMGDGLFLNGWTGTDADGFVQAFVVSSDVGVTFRGGDDNFQLADTGPISPAALTTLTVNFSSLTTATALAVAFAPAGGNPEAKNWPIIGHKKRFTNDGGYTMEVRVVRTDDEALRDQIEVLLESPVTGLMQWYPITERANPLEQGTADRYYMDSYFYTNLEPNFSQRNSKLIWVNGTKTIFSWRGGVAPIVSMVPGVSLTTTAGKSWVSLGMNVPNSAHPAGETEYIVVKGIKYEVDSGWDTDTILLSNTNDIEVGDYATAYIAPAEADVLIPDTNVMPDSYPTIDFCKQNKNYMFYGSFQSRQLFMSNNFDRLPTETVKFIAADLNSQLDDLILSTPPTYNGTGVTVFSIFISSTGTPDTIQGFAVRNGVKSVLVITPDGSGFQGASLFGIIKFAFANTTGHTLGDTWEITAIQGIGTFFSLVPPGDEKNPPAWANFFYSLPRLPGQGYIFQLPANFWTMDVQEEDMYVGDQYGQWSYINTQIGTDLITETISFTPLKQIASAKPIFPYMVGHMENYIVFVTENKQLQFIGRQAFLELPQTDYLSEPVELDFEAASFELGSLEYLNKRLSITSPKESVMFVYDNKTENKYWQPPQVINENGILSIVGNTLITHSNLRDQTFNLFTGTSDNGAEFTVRARTALGALPRKGSNGRWDSKWSSNSFLEGYIQGNPQLVMTVFVAPNDQVGYSHNVKPVKTNDHTDNASNGESVLGAHPLGNDLVFEGNYFNEIYRKFKPVLNFYFVSLQIACVSKNHSYSILSMGINAVISPTGNNTLIGDREVL